MLCTTILPSHGKRATCHNFFSCKLDRFSSMNVKAQGTFTILLLSKDVDVNISCRKKCIGLHIHGHLHNSSFQRKIHFLHRDGSSSQRKFAHHVTCAVTGTCGNSDTLCGDLSLKVGRSDVGVQRHESSQSLQASKFDCCGLHIGDCCMLCTTILPSHSKGSSFHLRGGNKLSLLSSM